MQPIHANIENRLLAALPRGERRRFLAASEPVDLVFAQILVEAGEPIRDVYFPAGGFISLMTSLADGPGLEVGMVGSEGMFGISLILDVEVTPLRALVQGAGPARRMDAGTFRAECAASIVMQSLLKRYLFVFIGQIAQTAVCNRFHVVEARLARWLLMTRDRAHTHRFHVTHEFLAYMLGVRRVGVTKAASLLRNRGLIRYHRGDVTILDHHGLETAACGCYQADKVAYAWMLA